ncbi:SRPBCC family protein [Streptomyces sp. DSM 44915]|uniref:SRPBCC family protein n=1 Tax=Streptomyces chisholmiae TaxID=3075540 RepID=A0ABU2JUS7_9ACTN|nr:SRPBCC family protein [Streptomyces sp. DSM 44915]MDT0268740.1 SRPBCC family protein [Streptomyces sp. DSM 44915]
MQPSPAEKKDEDEGAAHYRITIDAPAADVLATLRDLAAYPDWQSGIDSFAVLDSDHRGLPLAARMTVHAMGMRATMALALEHGERTMRWRLTEGDVITRNDVEYTVADLPDGRTELRLRQVMALKWHMPASVTKLFTEQKIAGTMESVRKQAERTAQRPRP